MDAFHERLARVGLAAIDRYGFALAGGYAVQLAGLLERPSEDIDLFTDWAHRNDFDSAVAAVVKAYLADGLQVRIVRRVEAYLRLDVSDGTRTSTVDLGVDWRAHEPLRMALGPVLHPDDAVANKMVALYGRAVARDFIDIDAAVQSGRYEHERLLTLAERADAGFDRRMFAMALTRAGTLDDAAFAAYAIGGRELAGLRQRFAEWREALLSG